MKFGLLYEAQRPFKGTNIDWNKLYKETLEQCVLADKVGFDNLWFVEHHFLTGFSGSPCPEVLLGALSQMTKRVRIGFGVCILPSHHPVRAAEPTRTSRSVRASTPATPARCGKSRSR
jgi:alkanesulfonate monooxygenase SsuD/methylene tetrahydromethanopterin reductase-like flavin-dependent oxidoreductase (luciferase family)